MTGFFLLVLIPCASKKQALNIIAEKNTSPVSEETKYPVNLQYIDSSRGDDWSQMEDIYVNYDRPVITSDDKRLCDPDNPTLNIKLPHLTDHYIFLGSEF